MRITEEAAEAKQLLELTSKIKLTAETGVNDEVRGPTFSVTPTFNHFAFQLAMFHAIRSSDTSLLRALGAKFSTRNETIQALLCFDHYFAKFPPIIVMEASEVSGILDDFLTFCRLLYDVAVTPNSCTNPLVQQLFCIQPSTEKDFMLPTGTFLHKKIIESRVATKGVREDGVLIGEWDLVRRLRQFLFDRLRTRVMEENGICRRTQAFSPCLNFAINDQCHRRECPRKHIMYTSLTHAWYNLQVRLHLQQILIFQTLHPISVELPERRKQQR